MNRSTISSIKADVRKLHELFEDILKVFDGNKNVMISVLLQNLQFDGSNTVNWNEKEDFERMQQIRKTLRSLANYNANDWLPAYISEEVEIIFMTHEIYEEDECSIYIPHEG